MGREMCGFPSLIEKWLNQPFAAPSKGGLDKVIERYFPLDTSLTRTDV
jgi:hypothetical protein